MRSKRPAAAAWKASTRAASHVEHFAVDAAARGLDGPRSRRQVVGVAIAQREVRAEARERPRDGRADPDRRAGDDGDAVREQHRARVEFHGIARPEQ
jgi:hypothetical protein